MAETIISRVIAGDATTSPLGKSDHEVLSKLQGRWEITATTPAREPSIPWEVTLRVDGATVSGDVFEPLEPRLLRRQMRLGGRDDWRFSFWGRVSEAIDDDRVRWLTASCDASHRLMPRSALDPRAILSLRLATTEDGELRPEIRLTLLHDLGGGGALAAIGERRGAAQAGVPSAPLKRKVHLRYMVFLQNRDPARAEMLERLFQPSVGSDTWTLPYAMDSEGVELTVEAFDATILGRSRRHAPTPDGLLEDALVHIAEHSAASRNPAPGESAPPDWTLALVLADQPRKGKPHGGSQILGRAYGLVGGQNRFRTRFGAIVHIDEIEKEMPGFDQGLSKDEALRRLVLHYIMHELGHLLNLPHCWERDRGFRVLGAAAPASDSYMNYASSWPFGPAAADYYAALGAPLNAVPRNAQGLQYFTKVGLTGPSRTLGFDASEREFIRHAPFDQIAQGGRTFLDATLPEPAFLPPSEGDTLLEIGCRRGADFVPVEKLGLGHWRSSDGGTICFPPVPALVRFADPADPFVTDDFRFESAALQLLVRPAPLAKRRAYDPEPRTVVFDPSRSLRLIPDGALPPNLAFLPWMTFEDVMAYFLDNPAVFDLQVVYFRDSEKTYASNVVRVSFEDPQTHPATSREFRRFVETHNLQELRPDAHGRVPSARTLSRPRVKPKSIQIDNPF